MEVEEKPEVKVKMKEGGAKTKMEEELMAIKNLMINLYFLTSDYYPITYHPLLMISQRYTAVLQARIRMSRTVSYSSSRNHPLAVPSVPQHKYFNLIENLRNE